MGQSMPDSGYVRLFAMPIVIQLQIVHYYLPCCAAMQGKGERERENGRVDAVAAVLSHVENRSNAPTFNRPCSNERNRNGHPSSPCGCS
jgi:hypothetical protein